MVPDTCDRAKFEAALRDYHVVQLGVAYEPEVVVPTVLMTSSWRERQSIICLEYGLDMPVPIDAMLITDEGVGATLSFDRVPQYTFVPWKEVIGFGVEGERKPATPPKKKSFLKSVP